ncbi:MAG: adenylyltransferase/cytidyltransferase family protein [Candidatus Coatesbacteria bacterium]|nr:MAG: adenylyltransferase/cytidyltransferase family protein [Candidatus Coatesbacteria bacterium]
MDCADKILPLAELRSRLTPLREAGQRIVFTNGVFDLLHAGHVRYLEEASRLGDVLVVAVNGDASARRLAKGPGRPFNRAEDRALVLAGLWCVSFVTLFDDDTPYDVIAALVPDVLVKGGDWPEEDIVGADVVRAAGGEVRSLPYVEGYSTTALAERIARAVEGADHD